MRKFVSCICVCLALVVAVMPLCAFKCADVSNAPAIVENRPVMTSNRPFVEPVVQPLYQLEIPPWDTVPYMANMLGKYVIDLSLPNGSMSTADAGGYAMTLQLMFTNAEFIVYDFESNTELFRVNENPNAVAPASATKVSLYLTQSSTGDIQARIRRGTSSFTTLYTFPVGSKYILELAPAYDSVTDLRIFYSDSDDSRFDFVSSSGSSISTAIDNSAFRTNINKYFSFSVFYTYHEPEPTVIETLIDIMISGITAFAENIGKGINDVVVNVFVDTSQETFALTTFGGVVAVFGGLALAVGLSKVVSSFIMRLGGKE